LIAPPLPGHDRASASWEESAMLRAFAVSVMAAMMVAPVAAATAESLFETCDEDIDCTEKWYWLGETLFLHEAGASNTVGPAAETCLAANSAAWREAVGRACTGPDCVEAAYMDRLASLAPLQPGMNQITRELPEVAELVAVLGPETGADPQGSGEPLEIAGDLLLAGEHREHMGIAIDAGDGAAHVITFDMDIGNQPGHQMLLSLIESDPDARFHVSGTAEIAPDGVANFNTDQCRYVYRLP
jgi:hypothetical protein